MALRQSNSDKERAFDEKKLFEILATEMGSIREGTLIQFFSAGGRGSLDGVFKENFYDDFEGMVRYVSKESGYGDEKGLCECIEKGFRRSFWGSVGEIFLRSSGNKAKNQEHRITEEVLRLAQIQRGEMRRIAKNPEERKRWMAKYGDLMPNRKQSLTQITSIGARPSKILGRDWGLRILSAS